MLPLMEEFKQVRIFRAEEFQTLLYLHHIIDNLCGSGKGHFSKVNNSPQYFDEYAVPKASVPANLRLRFYWGRPEL